MDVQLTCESAASLAPLAKKSQANALSTNEGPEETRGTFIATFPPRSSFGTRNMVTGHHVHDAYASEHAGRGRTVITAFACCLAFWGLVGCLVTGVF
jgi:hypothetical protein